MYNYDIEINYNHIEDDLQNREYQKQLLKVFSTDNGNILKINQIQCQLYQHYKSNESLNEILDYFKNNQRIIPLELSLETCFVFLFSFDFFYHFHKCLQDLKNENNISEVNKEILYFLIKKK